MENKFIWITLVLYDCCNIALKGGTVHIVNMLKLNVYRVRFKY